MAKRNIAKTMLSVSGIVILGKILGFIKQMVTANAFGATIRTDLISISEGLIANTDYLLVQALSTAFIPIYIAAKAKGDKEAKGFVSNTIKIFFVVTVGISLAFFAFSPFIARLLAPSYSAELSGELAKYIRIISPILILIVELAVFNALLKANESFVPGELVGFNQSVILIALVFALGNIYGPDTLVFSYFAYAVFNLLFLMILSRKYWHIGKGNPFADENVKQLLKMMGPLILGYSMVFVNQQVDKIIVSGLGEGTVTAMNYAAVLSNFVSTFIGSICGVLFTYVAKNISEKKDGDAAELTMTAVIQIGTILLPVSLLVMMNAKDIVTIVFGRGKFGISAIESCSMALIGYGLMFVPYLVRELFSRFQYAYKDSKRPMINSSISIVVNIVLSIALSKVMGVLGVTLATSISVFVCAALNIWSSKKRNTELRLHGSGKYIFRWTMGVAICVAFSLIGQNILSEVHALIRFIVITVLSLGIYAIILFPVIKSLVNKLLKEV